MGEARLLVEGRNDRHVMWALLKAHQIEPNFSVEDVGGVQRLQDNLRVRLLARSEDRLGIMVDADERLEHRWRSLRDTVDRVHPGVMPEVPDPGGTVVTLPGGRRLGMWLMPNNRLPGVLEDFVAMLVPREDRTWTAALEFVDGLDKDTVRFPIARRSKARLHAWLAVQAEPGKPIGQAITARYLEVHAAGPLLGWVRRVFGDERSSADRAAP